MGWLAVVTLIFQYGPSLFEAIKSLIDAIRSKNTDSGTAAVSRAAGVAMDVVVSLKTRSDLTDAQKREQAWKDVQMGAKLMGVTLSESESRTLAELTLQKVKATKGG